METNTRSNTTTIPEEFWRESYSESKRFLEMGYSYLLALKTFVKDHPQWSEDLILAVFPKAWRVTESMYSELFDRDLY